MSDAKREVADRLLKALKDRASVAPVTVALDDNLDAAYEVQELVMSDLESPTNPRVGRKVGLTSPAVQAQLGVDQPDFGVLLADMEVSPEEVVDSSRLIQPKIEAEIAFVMGKDVETATPEAILGAVDYMVAALEIVDSRISNWEITIVDTVADNVSSGLFTLGTTKKTLEELDPKSVVMEMTVDGEVASVGDGEACLGDPRNALIWVAQTAEALGAPLRAGEVVLSGALGPLALFPPGATVEAKISGLGTVTATASER